jgi:adenylate kinase
LTIDLNFKPSPLMVTDETLDFTWHCEKGLPANIELVKNEFCKVNDLKPIKIFITGPPLSGKSHFGKQLSEEYNIPHI